MGTNTPDIYCFGDKIGKNKYSHLSLDNYVYPDLKCSLWLAEFIIIDRSFANNEIVQLREYVEKCLKYFSEITNGDYSLLKGKNKRICYSMLAMIGKMDKGNFRINPNYPPIPYENYNLASDILGSKYSEKYYLNQIELLKLNYRINVEHFASLDYKEFKHEVDSFLKKHKRFKEITFLDEACFRGCYLIILEEYKQVYIGKSNFIAERLHEHLTRNKNFDRRIFGNANESKISIDSFGYLDISRIFVCDLSNAKSPIETYEEKYISCFSNKFLANRLAGDMWSAILKR